jgi:hypothetical protein
VRYFHLIAHVACLRLHAQERAAGVSIGSNTLATRACRHARIGGRDRLATHLQVA